MHLGANTQKKFVSHIMLITIGTIPIIPPILSVTIGDIATGIPQDIIIIIVIHHITTPISTEAFTTHFSMVVIIVPTTTVDTDITTHITTVDMDIMHTITITTIDATTNTEEEPIIMLTMVEEV